MVKLAVTLKWLFHIDIFIGSWADLPTHEAWIRYLFSANGNNVCQLCGKDPNRNAINLAEQQPFLLFFFCVFFFFFLFYFFSPHSLSFPRYYHYASSTVRYRTVLVVSNHKNLRTMESIVGASKHRTCSCIGASMKSKAAPKHRTCSCIGTSIKVEGRKTRKGGQGGGGRSGNGSGMTAHACGGTGGAGCSCSWGHHRHEFAIGCSLPYFSLPLRGRPIGCTRNPVELPSRSGPTIWNSADKRKVFSGR